MNADNYIKGQIAAYCIQEGHGAGGADKMIAIAHVLRNRVAAGWQGGDWMAVLENAAQNRAKVPPPLAGLDLRNGSVKAFLQAVDDIYAGAEEDELTGGALYYADLHDITNSWFLENIARDPINHPRTATVGLTAFFS